MSNPQEIKDLIIRKLIEDKQYTTVLHSIMLDEALDTLRELNKPKQTILDKLKTKLICYYRRITN
jgi:chromosome condensin MukBEF complex kleisin-like MukF subunit